MERSFPVVLTLDELKTKGQRLAQHLQRIEELKAEKAETNRYINEFIKGLNKKVVDICQLLRDGRELRLVAVEEKIYFETNTLEVYRLDTGEKVEVRALTSEEREKYSQGDFRLLDESKQQ